MAQDFSGMLWSQYEVDKEWDWKETLLTKCEVKRSGGIGEEEDGK